MIDAMNTKLRWNLANAIGNFALKYLCTCNNKGECEICKLTMGDLDRYAQFILKNIDDKISNKHEDKS